MAKKSKINRKNVILKKDKKSRKHIKSNDSKNSRERIKSIKNKINKKNIISLIPKLILVILLLVIINTQLSESVVLSTLEKGLVFSFLALGIFITFRILDIPDLSVDGTFTLGVVLSVMNAYNGHPIKGLILAVIAGAAAGCVTGLLVTKLKVQPILAGIITMTALYSINLIIMSRPNLSLWRKDTLFTYFESTFGEYTKVIVVGGVLIIVSLFLFVFLKTQLGMSLRATGDNEFMVRASSINSDTMKILGFALANALVSLSGAMYAQYSSSGDTNSGTGMLVVGLASIIIGEIFFKKHSILFGILAAIIGATAYRYVLAYAMGLGMDTNYTKLFSAIIVAIAIAVPAVKLYAVDFYKRYIIKVKVVLQNVKNRKFKRNL